ncbi:MAG: GerMN domain-containing protein [Chloroflexota bacterium]
MKLYRVLVLFMGLLLSACGDLQVTVEQATPTTMPTNIPPLPSSTATVAVLPTSSPIPTLTFTASPPTPIPPTATGSQTIPASPTTGSQQEIEIFLILLEDNGRSGTLVGCGDSVVPVAVYIPKTQGVLRAAMEKMVSARQQFYGETGYYNALYQSDLEVENVTIEQGKAIVHLTGSLMLGGTCDSPRVEAQLEQTALQFSTVTDVQIFINDVPLEDVLSQK